MTTLILVSLTKCRKINAINHNQSSIYKQDNPAIEMG